MAGTAYHMEALRRQRVLERKAEAAKRIDEAIGQTGDASELAKDLKQQYQQLVFSEPGQYAQNRQTLTKYRVDSAGFNNRYRGRQFHSPHCDLAYAVVYPGKDNSDYIADENRTNRRINKNADKYEINRKVNEFVTDIVERKMKERTKLFPFFTHVNITSFDYYKIGPERDRLQYDHSRDGPVVDRTRYNLRREFDFLGQSLGMVKSDIQLSQLPTPTCRRY